MNRICALLITEIFKFQRQFKFKLFILAQRVAEEEKRRAAREEEIIRLEKEESDLLERLKNAQVSSI